MVYHGGHTMDLPTLPTHLQVEPSKSVDKLNKLQFDPIQKLVILHDNIDKEINSMLYDEEGNPKRKFSQVAYATLLGIQAKISNDLMRYGYARVTELPEPTVSAAEPIRIMLTRPGKHPAAYKEGD
jgi:hypothetical protein